MEFLENYEDNKNKEENNTTLEKLQTKYNELFQKYVDIKKENYCLHGQIRGLKHLEIQCIITEEKYLSLKKTYELTQEWRRMLIKRCSSKLLLPCFLLSFVFCKSLFS